MMQVPIYVPVELRPEGAAGPRHFRLALAVGMEGLRLRSAVPDELADRPLRLRFHLPLELDPKPEALEVVARAEEVVVDRGEETERAELGAVRFVAPSERVQGLLLLYLQSHGVGF